MKFIISGGGICGLTTAIALQKQGFEVEIYEAASEIKAAGAGLSLSTNAIRALKSIGIAEQIIDISHTQTGFRFYTENGQILTKGSFAFLVEKYGVPGIISMHRTELHRALLDCLEGRVAFHTHKRGQRVEQNSNGVQLHFADGTSAKGDYLLACDGIHSAIRRQLLPNVAPRYAGYTIWRGLMRDDIGQLEVKYPFKTWGKAGQFGGVEMKNKHFYWFASIKAPSNDPTMKAITVADLQKRFASYHAPVPQILELSQDENLLLNDAIDLAPISQFAFNKVLLMGDAAHAMTPNLGQGAGQAIEDAAILAKWLKKGIDIEKAFLAFEKERLPRTAKVTHDSWRMGKAAHLNNRLVIGLRNFYLRLASNKAMRKSIDYLNSIEF